MSVERTADAPVLVRLAVSDVGEALTLQRAAYVTEAQAHHDLFLPALVQTQAELLAELADPALRGFGLRDGSRLIAAVRIRVDDDAAYVGRLAVVPDRQREGLGSRVLLEAEQSVLAEFPGIERFELITGEKSLGNLALYERHGYLEDGRSSAGSYQIVHLTKRL